MRSLAIEANRRFTTNANAWLGRSSAFTEDLWPTHVEGGQLLAALPALPNAEGQAFEILPSRGLTD